MNNSAVIKKLNRKRNEVNFYSFKVLAIMLNNFENRKDDSLSVTYDSRKYNQDLYNNYDLNNITRSNAKLTIQGKMYYYLTVVQTLETLVFGPNAITIIVTKNNKGSVHRLSVTNEVMKANYDLIKSYVENIKPIIDSLHIKKSKKKIVLNKYVTVVNESSELFVNEPNDNVCPEGQETADIIAL